MQTSTSKLIHIAKYLKPKEGWRYLFLRKDDPCLFRWYEQTLDKSEQATEVSAPNIEEAIRLASRTWKLYSYRTLHCGFTYTLPERDEHGSNALFHQMVDAYRSPSGSYFDEEIGCNSQVHRASLEALDLWKTLESQEKLGF